MRCGIDSGMVVVLLITAVLIGLSWVNIFASTNLMGIFFTSTYYHSMYFCLVFVIVIFWVRSCLLITLIRCIVHVVIIVIIEREIAASFPQKLTAHLPATGFYQNI